MKNTPSSFRQLFLPVFLSVVLSSQSWAQPIMEPKDQEASGSGPVLNIRDFLNQVREKHGTYQSAEEARDAAKLYENEGHLLLSPSLFASAQNTMDKKPGTFFTYDSAVTNTYQLGVSETTSVGLSGRLYYTATDLTYTNLTALGSPGENLHYLQASPVLELTLPLWRNWLGEETRNQVEQSDAQSASTTHMQAYNMKSVLSQAATAYWNLALSRESMRVAQDAVERDEQLVKWHERRQRNGLGDKADVLQAQAALQTKLIDLKNAQDNERAFARIFNLSRGRLSSSVAEKLMPLDESFVDQIKIPERSGNREDVTASIEQSKSTTAAAEVSRQKYLPTLELYGSAALNNGNPTDVNNAYADSFRTDRPTNTIGIRLNAPLDLGLISNVRQGWAKEKKSAELTAQRKLLEQENDWNDLVDKFHQSQERFGLYQKLEKKQKEKFDYERARRTAGRTTTQQVLNFELDYEQAQLGRIQSLSDMLLVYSQMKMYEGVSDGSR